MNRDDVLRLALATMERIAVLVPRDDPQVGDAIIALRTALAEAEEPDLSKCPNCGDPTDNGHEQCSADEPVAWGYETATGFRLIHWMDRCDIRRLQNDQEAARLYPTGHRVWPLFAHPPRREPLTDDFALSLWGARTDGPNNNEIIDYCRAVERAHGIGGDE